MASIFFTERPPGHFQIHKVQRRRQAAHRAGLYDCLFADFAQLSGDGQPYVGRPASTTNRSGFLKSRLYAKSLTSLILECYQTFN
jgi:hypothetical protein